MGDYDNDNFRARRNNNFGISIVEEEDEGLLEYEGAYSANLDTQQRSSKFGMK
jgi:hypothetical protein